MVAVKPVVDTDDTHISPAVVPDSVAVTFGVDANAELNVIVNVPELVVPDPYKYLVILNVDMLVVIDDTFVVIDDTLVVIDDIFVFIDDTFTASVSMPDFNVLGTGEIQFSEAAGIYDSVVLTYVVPGV